MKIKYTWALLPIATIWLIWPIMWFVDKGSWWFMPLSVTLTLALVISILVTVYKVL